MGRNTRKQDVGGIEIAREFSVIVNSYLRK